MPLPIRVAMGIFAIVSYQSAFSSAAGPAMTALACRCLSGSLIPTTAMKPSMATTRNAPYVPLLLQRLSPLQRRLLWHR